MKKTPTNRGRKPKTPRNGDNGDNKDTNDNDNDNRAAAKGEHTGQEIEEKEEEKGEVVVVGRSDFSVKYLSVALFQDPLNPPSYHHPSPSHQYNMMTHASNVSSPSLHSLSVVDGIPMEEVEEEVEGGEEEEIPMGMRTPVKSGGGGGGGGEESMEEEGVMMTPSAPPPSRSTSSRNLHSSPRSGGRSGPLLSAVANIITSSSSSSYFPSPPVPPPQPSLGSLLSQHELHAWGDIFANMKLLLSWNPHNFQNPFIQILQAQREFFLNFGSAAATTTTIALPVANPNPNSSNSSHSSSSSSSSKAMKNPFLSPESLAERVLPLPLRSIYGNATERHKIIQLEQAYLMGKTFMDFINFHKFSNGSSLSCHCSLLPLTNYHHPFSLSNVMMENQEQQQSSLSSSELDSSSSSSSSSSPSLRKRVMKSPKALHTLHEVQQETRYAILTIRSASVVGNSKFSGIGLMGTYRIDRNKINQQIK